MNIHIHNTMTSAIHPRTRFAVKNVYRHKQPHAFHFTSQKYSFWIATLSVFTFLIGNMVGQTGWYGFWHSVLGAADDSLIVFTGTVSPIEKVPNYEKWAMYGGNSEEHTYKMVPKDLLIPLPAYDTNEMRHLDHDLHTNLYYSVGHMGSYDTGAEMSGSHVGTDIRVPVGTPVRSIANGIVQSVKNDAGGYGNYIMIRHPNVPASYGSKNTTTIYSIYAHLDAAIVSEGMIVQKGQNIGLSGKTGFATGPHLHFQIDKETAPWHPYWPFTTSEASQAKLSFVDAINKKLHQERGVEYTLNSMVFVQQMSNVTGTTIARQNVRTNDALARRTISREERISSRKNQRLATLPNRTAVLSTTQASSISITRTATTAPTTPVAPVITSAPVSSSSASSTAGVVPVSMIEIHHDGYYNRSWETVFVTAFDAAGNEIASPSFSGEIYLKAGFGDAQFKPSSLRASDFKNGRAEIQVLPSSSRPTLIIETKGAFETMSKPMTLEK